MARCDCVTACLRLAFLTVPSLIWTGFRLLLFVLALSPAFARFSWYYWFSGRRGNQGRRVVRYGHESCRQTLDVYSSFAPEVAVAADEDGGCTSMCTRDLLEEDVELGGTVRRRQPVVVFFTGGAWIIGYRMWGALLARALTAAGLTVVIPDYRNYPEATVPDMVRDVESALQWTVDHIEDETEGDASNIVVVGQSAGGHLLSTALVRDALRRRRRETQEQTSVPHQQRCQSDCAQRKFRATDFKGIVSLSAPYCLTAMQDTFRKHGLDAHLVDRIFGGERDDYDPSWIARGCNRETESLRGYLPPVKVYHGSRDGTVPCEGSKDFADELQKAGITVDFHSYDGWSHTDPILEGPMDADHRFHRDLFHSVCDWSGRADLSWPDDNTPELRRLCPHLLVQLGRFFMPF